MNLWGMEGAVISPVQPHKGKRNLVRRTVWALPVSHAENTSVEIVVGIPAKGEGLSKIGSQIAGAALGPVQCNASLAAEGSQQGGP